MAPKTNQNPPDVHAFGRVHKREYGDKDSCYGCGAEVLNIRSHMNRCCGIKNIRVIIHGFARLHAAFLRRHKSARKYWKHPGQMRVINSDTFQKLGIPQDVYGCLPIDWTPFDPLFDSKGSNLGHFFDYLVLAEPDETKRWVKPLEGSVEDSVEIGTLFEVNGKLTPMREVELEIQRQRFMNTYGLASMPCTEDCGKTPEGIAADNLADVSHNI